MQPNHLAEYLKNFKLVLNYRPIDNNNMPIASGASFIYPSFPMAFASFANLYINGLPNDIEISMPFT